MKPLNLPGPINASNEDRAQETADCTDEAQPTEDPPAEGQSHYEPTEDEAYEANSEQPEWQRSRSNRQSDQSHRSRPYARRRPPAPPTREQLLAVLVNLPQLIARRLISTAEANSMHAVLKTLLAATGSQHFENVGSGVDASRLRAAVHNDPEVLDVVAPLLSDEQLVDLMNDD